MDYVLGALILLASELVGWYAYGVWKRKQEAKKRSESAKLAAQVRAAKRLDAVRMEKLKMATVGNVGVAAANAAATYAADAVKRAAGE